jgi:hypothetical protein
MLPAMLTRIADPKPGMGRIRVAGVLLLGINSILFMNCAGTSTMRPFETDGCSHFPDGTLNDQSSWLSCCTRHDVAYWRGGTSAERKEADQALEACVEDVRNQALGRVMYRGVRAGGHPWWPTSYRWGYGWAYGRGYEALSVEEERLADGLWEENRASK